MQEQSSIEALARGIRDGKTSFEALMEGVVARYKAREDTLGAYKHFDGPRALAEARAMDGLLAAGHDAGPLMGLPVSLKDLYGVEGMPICGGTPSELPESWQREGPVVQALRRALGIVTGKSHTVEFAYGGVGTNRHWGAPRNPWDAEHHRVSGGSSSGAGVSLCQGTAVVAMGTDTGGSVRIPASVTGNVGLKVTAERWSLDGIVPLSSTFDTPGPLARSVPDAAIAYAVIERMLDPLGWLESLRGLEAADLRLGVCDEHFWEDCEPGIAEGVQGAIDALSKKGARIKKLPFAEAGLAREHAWKAALFSVEGMSFIEEHYPERIETVDPDVGRRLALGGAVSAVDYVKEKRTLERLAGIADEKLRHVDALITPTVPVTPPTLDAVADEETYVHYMGRMPCNTQPVNQLRLTAITLPVALDAAGMPVGLQLIARGGQEAKLLSVALACEQALGTGRERLGTPPLCTS